MYPINGNQYAPEPIIFPLFGLVVHAILTMKLTNAFAIGSGGVRILAMGERQISSALPTYPL